MAYDATFLTGSSEKPVDPISIGYLHNDQMNADLEQSYSALTVDGDNFNLAIEAYDQMNDIGFELDSNVRRGQVLTGAMYRILGMEAKSAARRTGAKFDTLPAMESLTTIHPRELTIALENAVTDFIKDMWEKMKSTFIAIHNKVKDWYIKAWDGSARLKTQAEAMKAKAEGMTASSPRETSFEMSGLKFLNIGGKPATAQEIAKGVEEISKISSNLLTTNAESYTNMFPKLESVLKDTVEQARNMKDSDAINHPKKPPSADIGDTFNGAGNQAPAGTEAINAAGNTATMTGSENKLLVEIVKLWTEAAKGCNIDLGTALQNDPRFESGKVFAYRNKETLLGDIMVVAVFPVPPDAQTIESYADFKAGFKISPEPINPTPKEVQESGTFQTAQTAVVINICENIISSCDLFLKYKLLYDARDKATGNLMKQMEQYVSSNSSLKGPGQRHISNSISATVACMKKMNDGETRWSKYAMSVLNKSMVYCRTSIAQY